MAMVSGSLSLVFRYNPRFVRFNSSDVFLLGEVAECISFSPSVLGTLLRTEYGANERPRLKNLSVIIHEAKKKKGREELNLRSPFSSWDPSARERSFAVETATAPPTTETLTSFSISPVDSHGGHW